MYQEIGACEGDLWTLRTGVGKGIFRKNSDEPFSSMEDHSSSKELSSEPESELEYYFDEEDDESVKENNHQEAEEHYQNVQDQQKNVNEN